MILEKRIEADAEISKLPVILQHVGKLDPAALRNNAIAQVNLFQALRLRNIHDHLVERLDCVFDTNQRQSSEL